MELDLKDRSILFAVLIIDGVQVMSDEPFDRMFPMDNDAFRDYIESEMIMDDSVDVEYTYYSLGSGESDSADDNELDYIAEKMYLKQNGEFFLHGVGGAKTQYAERVGNNMWGSGESISPLAYQEAEKWAEEHLSGDEYESIFGEISQSDENVTVHISMEKSKLESIRRKASENGMNLSEYIASSLAE